MALLRYMQALPRHNLPSRSIVNFIYPLDFPEGEKYKGIRPLSLLLLRYLE